MKITSLKPGDIVIRNDEVFEGTLERVRDPHHGDGKQPALRAETLAPFVPTPGPWRVGTNTNPLLGPIGERRAYVVADVPSGHDDPDNVRVYGGHLICESVQPHNLELIAAAPAMLAAIREVAERLESARAHDCKGADCATCYPNGLAEMLREAIATVPQ